MNHSLPRALGKGVAWGTFSSVGIRVITILYLLMVLRELTLYQYGLLELVITIPTFLSLCMLPGLSHTITADMGAEKGRGNLGNAWIILKNYTYLRWALSIIPFLILFMGAGLIERWYNEEIALMVQIIACTFLTSPLKHAVQILLRVYARFDKLALYALGEELVKLLLVAGGLYVLDLGVLAIVYAIVIAELVTTLIILPFCRSLVSELRSAPQGAYKPFYDSIAHHGKWGVSTSYLGSLGNSIRLWIIKFLLGTEAVGLFAVAYGFFQQTISLFPLHTVIAPYLFETTDEARFKKLVGKGIKYIFLGYAFVSLAVGCVAPLLIHYLFPQYVPSLPLFYALLVAIVPVSVAGMMTFVFIAKREQKELFVMTLRRTLSIIVLAPLCILGFGVLGIACEIVLTSALYTYERYRRAKVLLPGFSLSWRDFVFFDAEDRQWVRAILATMTAQVRRIMLSKV